MASEPVTGQAFFVLTALAEGPRHGYGIVGEVAELSRGRVRLKIGRVLPAFHALLLAPAAQRELPAQDGGEDRHAVRVGGLGTRYSIQ
jgi:DNA-binding PadR family transcriptional regulator